MKIRTDYVSNSSSSSFVIGTHPAFTHFHITKQDILDALIEIYGGREVYDRTVALIKSAAKKEPEYYKDSLKYNSFGPFYVYDLFDENDRKEAIERWGDLLNGWWASNCHIVRNDPDDEEGELVVGRDEFKDFEQAVSAISNIYDVSMYSLMDYARGANRGDDPPKRFIRSDKQDPKTGLWGHYEPLDPEVLSVVNKLCYEVGAITNLGVIRSEMARFFVHADDNELQGKQMCDDSKDATGNPIWESESYTYDRVCEIMFKHFVLTGKIVPDDPEFMKKMECDPEYLTESEKSNGEIYDFCNGTNFTWADLKWNSMTWNMHEG